MIPKGYRLSFSHIVFYISTFVIATQLWSIWGQSKRSHYLDFARPTHSHRGWEFNADIHANVHTLSSEQCNVAFPELYHSLDQSVNARQGRKVHPKDIEITAGRCMLRVMIYQGEVGLRRHPSHPDQCSYYGCSCSSPTPESQRNAMSKMETRESAFSVLWHRSTALS